MSEIPLSNSPFLNRPIKINDYGTNVPNQTEVVELEQPVETKPDPKPKAKKVISAKQPLPELEKEDIPLTSDPDVELFEFENPNNEQPDVESVSEEEAEKMSGTQARETAKAIIMVVNQIFTLVGNSVCLLDEESIYLAIEKGELPKEVEKWASEVNERNRKEIPFDNEQQAELVRALAIILKESNYTAINPIHMALFSICMVFLMQIKKLNDIKKSNEALLKEALGLNIQRESNIPEVEIEVVKTDSEIKPTENKKVANNEKQVVA